MFHGNAQSIVVAFVRNLLAISMGDFSEQLSYKVIT